MDLIVYIVAGVMGIGIVGWNLRKMAKGGCAGCTGGPCNMPCTSREKSIKRARNISTISE